VDIPWGAGAKPVEPPDDRNFPTTWKLLDDVQLLDLPDPQFLVDRLIPSAGVGAIYAPSGAGKTTLIAGLTVCLATGRPFFGHEITRPGATVYVATEDASGFKVRLRAAKQAAGLSLDEPIGVFTFPEPIDLRDPLSVARFRHFLEQSDWTTFPLVAIVVDTYAAATPGASENSSEDTTLAMVHAQQWRDALGVTVILVHHTNAGGSRERGHSAMRGAADFMIALNPVDDAIHVECSKQRNAAPFEKLLLKLIPGPDGAGCVMRLASDVLPSSELSAAQAKAYAVLRDSFTADGATKSEWLRSCPDLPERTFYHATTRLIDRGYVKQAGSHFRTTGKPL
jgi:hypothetical protein